MPNSPTTRTMWLWTWSGRSFGYREGDLLWTYDGRNVGRFVGVEILSPTGEYLGEVSHDDRLFRDGRKSQKSGDPYRAEPDRPPRNNREDLLPNTFKVGYLEFPIL